MTAVQPIRPAATVIIVRDAPSSFEIFMVRRTSGAAFAGGMYVFPGGRVDGDDHLHKYDEWRVGPSDAQAAQQDALGAEWRGYWIAGIRESFEEAGLLLAYGEDGDLVNYDDPDTHARFEAYRSPLHAGQINLRDICERENVRLAVDRIHFHDRVVTPLGRPRRFDTRFFIADAPPSQTGQHDEKETVDSVWITPEEALARHDAEEFGLMSVTRAQLEGLVAHGSKASVIAAAQARETFSVTRPVLVDD
ncbi:MAG: NUDIX hydrolase [Gammaproteobacteria bacterium]|nr:NUDIX hydrolase [Gammaproteobacteria bacterium]|tara:strand:- start:1040 stop:1786 length:747 start_codon:yes stop_codon:yes gene_type:complete